MAAADRATATEASTTSHGEDGERAPGRGGGGTAADKRVQTGNQTTRLATPTVSTYTTGVEPTPTPPSEDGVAVVAGAVLLGARHGQPTRRDAGCPIKAALAKRLVRVRPPHMDPRGSLEPLCWFIDPIRGRHRRSVVARPPHRRAPHEVGDRPICASR